MQGFNFPEIELALDSSIESYEDCSEYVHHSCGSNLEAEAGVVPCDNSSSVHTSHYDADVTSQYVTDVTDVTPCEETEKLDDEIIVDKECSSNEQPQIPDKKEEKGEREKEEFYEEMTKNILTKSFVANDEEEEAQRVGEEHRTEEEESSSEQSGGGEEGGTLSEISEIGDSSSDDLMTSRSEDTMWVTELERITEESTVTESVTESLEDDDRYVLISVFLVSYCILSYLTVSYCIFLYFTVS